MQELTPSRLKERLDYDPETGIFSWRSSKCARQVIGKRAGRINGRGYWLIKVEGRFYSAHRLAWLYMRGVFPRNIDHVNGIKTDNRFFNLCECDKSQNQHNTGRRKNNTLGFRGVSINGFCGYGAAIRVKGKYTWLGTFPTPELASEAYEKKARETHGEFYREVANA